MPQPMPPALPDIDPVETGEWIDALDSLVGTCGPERAQYVLTRLQETKKGYGMGGAGESRMTAHQAKKLDEEALLAFRDRFDLPLSDDATRALEFYRPGEDSAEMRYLHDRRRALGGYLPRRRTQPSAPQVTRPAPEDYAGFARDAAGKSMSTTMAAVRMLSALVKDKLLGPRIVPIVAEEARTFGMDNLFRQIGIYAPDGQLYEPQDKGSMLYYKESASGQLLEEGITEAGAISSWTAAATAYSIHDTELLPVYIYYSMFGFQRVGDLIWAAADQRARGFLLGATAGRTTLSGEGLQHQDGTSQLIAATIPNCRAYDPAFACELAVIMEYGMTRMIDERRDEFFYITVMNENYAQPSLPAGAEADIIRGMYRHSIHGNGAVQVRLLGAGTILREVIGAAETLAAEHGITCEVFSVTSFSELAREGAEVERRTREGEETAPAHVSRLLSGPAPIIAATDYVRAVPQQIATYVDAPMTVLGTDGFGRSANRENLRRYFGVDRETISKAALHSCKERS